MVSTIIFHAVLIKFLIVRNLAIVSVFEIDSIVLYNLAKEYLQKQIFANSISLSK